VEAAIQPDPEGDGHHRANPEWRSRSGKGAASPAWGWNPRLVNIRPSRAGPTVR